MKKKVTFEKKINFPTMIGEITAISLEHNLKFIDETSVEGDLILQGKYKLTEASRLEEDFYYNVPVEISLLERLDLNTTNIEITDFYYEIENQDTMNCHIELLLEGVEVIDCDDEVKDEKDDDRECDGEDVNEENMEIPVLEQEENEEINEIYESNNKEEVEDEQDMENNEEIESDSLFVNLGDDSDTYGTFVVYIVRQNESINSIIEKYHTTLEEIEKYNDVHDLTIGTKLIIPVTND